MVLAKLASASVPIEAAWLDVSPQGGPGERAPSLHPESGHEELSVFFLLPLTL